MRAALRSIEVMLAPGFVEAIAIPVRVCSASKDSVVPPTGHARFVERLPDGELVTIEGALHELLLEADAYRERMLAAFDEFMA